MKDVKVTRAHLKKAQETENWDLLDLLLEMDASSIDDNALYTDTWGEWWGLLFQAVRKDALVAVHILLKHGANPLRGSWGDCIPMTPLELAYEYDSSEIIQLLEGKKKPAYQRSSDPIIPPLSDYDLKVNRQGDGLKESGMVFIIEEDQS